MAEVVLKSGKSWEGRDTDWRTYEVVGQRLRTPELAKDPEFFELPAIGERFRAWPWGENVYRTEGLARTVISLGVINTLIDNNVIKLVAPVRLVKKAA